MRRIFAILMVLCMVFCFAACGSKSGKTDEPANQPAETNTNTDTQQPAGNEKVSIKGEIKDNIYENSYLNLRVPLPSGWVFYTEEQIAQANNMTAEVFEKTDIADAVKTAGQYMDMIMTNGVGNTLNLIIQPMDATLSFYSDEQLFTLMESTMKEQFASAGLTVDAYEPLTMKVGGEDRTVLHMVLGMSGYTFDEYQLWCRNGKEYLGIMTLSLMDSTDAQSVFDTITSLK